MEKNRAMRSGKLMGKNIGKKVLKIIAEELGRSLVILSIFISALYFWQRPSIEWDKVLLRTVDYFTESDITTLFAHATDKQKSPWMSPWEFRDTLRNIIRKDYFLQSIIDTMDSSSFVCFRDILVAGMISTWMSDSFLNNTVFKEIKADTVEKISGCRALIESLAFLYFGGDTTREAKLFSSLLRYGYHGDSVNFDATVFRLKSRTSGNDASLAGSIEAHIKKSPPDRKFIEYLLSDKRIKKKLKADSIQAIIYRERLKRQREEAFKKLKNDLVDTLKSVDLYETVLITFLSLGLAVILLFMLSWMGFYKGYVSGNEKLRSIWRNLMLLFSLPTVITAIFLQVTGLSLVIGDFSSIMVILPVVALLVIGSGIFAELWKQTESVGLKELKKPYFRIMMARDESSNITRKMLRRALLVHNINIVIRRGIYLFDALMLFMILIYVENEYLLTRFIPMENTADLQIRLARFSVGYVLLLFLFRASARILQVFIMRRSE